MLQVMDTQKRYSAGLVCDEVSLSSAVHVFEASWLGPFWLPIGSQGDNSIKHYELLDMIESNVIFFRLSPQRRKSNNVLDSKYGVIRSIFIRLLHESSLLSPQLAANRDLRIRNELYVRSALSALEIVNIFKIPFNRPLCHLPSELVDAHQNIATKRKLARILRSKPSVYPKIAPGDLLEIFIKRDH